MSAGAKMTPKARIAFEVYRDLGPGRTLRQVAELLGKSRGLMAKWSARHDWTRLTNDHDHAELREALGKREITRERGTQLMVDWIDEAALTLHEIMTNRDRIPILDRQGDHALDDNGQGLYRPMVKASTRMEAAKAILGIAGLVPVKRTETIDRTGEQLDAAGSVLRAMTPEQLTQLSDILGGEDAV